MKITLGFSPCPNDTFIFDALAHQKIDTEGLEFDIQLADVEELNRGAFAQTLDVTKLSYHAFAYAAGHYALLDAGSALGNNCGPLLIAKRPFPLDELDDKHIAIPGKYTTANFLLGLAFPKAARKTPMLFSDIEAALLNDEIDAGLIIHENRFTYEQKGLIKLIDLGEFWESATGMPIPLGGIVVRRSLPGSIQQKINRVVQRSVAFALDNPHEARQYVRQYAQEMDESVMYQHIGLYVNEYTRDLGEKGKAAVRLLFQKAQERQLIPAFEGELFVKA